MVRPLGPGIPRGLKSHASEKGAQQGTQFLTPMRAVYFSDKQREGLDISARVVRPVSSVPSQSREPPGAGTPVPAWRALPTDEVTGFRAEGVAIDEKV